MNKLALFDFDGTITSKDSFIEFIMYSKGIFAFLAGFLLLSPILVLLKLKVMANWRAKEWVMRYFWSGTELSMFNRTAGEFSEKVIPSICRPAAIEQIRKYKSGGWRVVVVSASASNWLAKWADNLGVELIATELVVEKGALTGRISGKNCYGAEKVKRIEAEISLSSYTEIHVYGDSAGDLQMLKLATKAFYKPFRS